MFFHYTLGTSFYYFLVMVASIFNAKAKSWVLGRKNQYLRVKTELSQHSGKFVIWIHVSSYGEFEMSKPLIEALRKKRSDIHFVISFYSPSGYERIELDKEIYTKIYLPLDLSRNQNRYIDLIKPSCVLFIKYDFWFNLLKCLHQKKVPFFFIGSHMEKDFYLFHPLLSSFLNLLKQAESIYVHNSISLEILKAQGFTNLKLLGDLRVPQVMFNKHIDFKDILHWKNPSRPTIIYGSVTKYELKYVLQAIIFLNDCNHILVLHDLEKESIARISHHEKVSLYSAVNYGIEKTVLVDTYGDLKYLYRYADIAYVGGGFEKGPHNILEPLVYGVPTIIGPNIYKFPMAQQSAKDGIVDVLSNIENLGNYLESILKADDSDKRQKRVKFVEANGPELEPVVNHINSQLKKSFE